MITKDEFEKGYAERSGVTVGWLHRHDQHGVPCDCGEDGCQGWKMVTMVIANEKDFEKEPEEESEN